MEKVILVDENDIAIGVEEKIKAHVAAKLHRAFSIFIFNSKKELMLQQRAKEKYHSGGLWTNTCCGHPGPGQDTLKAANGRLKEEMGLSCDLKEIFSLVYQARLDHGLTEYEYDHILIGKSEIEPILNLKEARAWQWISLAALAKDLKINQAKYSFWLKIAWPRLQEHLVAGCL